MTNYVKSKEQESPLQSFPMTDLQQAYWVGRRSDIELGGVALHFYFEVDANGLDLKRLERAWNDLVKHHEMLRAIILPTGELQILPQTPWYRIPVLNISDSSTQEAEATINSLRERLSHRVIDTSRWPVFDLRATQLPGKQLRIHISLDGLTVDMRSRHRLFQEWGERYVNPKASLTRLTGSFRDFAMEYAARKFSDAYIKAKRYWLDRLTDIAGGPDLPEPLITRSVDPPRFQRIGRRLTAADWSRLCERSRALGIRPSVVLITAFAEVLHLWSATQQFSLNLTLFDRAARKPDFSGVIGDFTSTTLLGLDTSGDFSFTQRCCAVQQRLMEDLAHSEFSGIEVIRELARHQGETPGLFAPVVFTGILSDSELQEDPLAWLGRTIFEISQTPQVTLDLQATERKGDLVLNFDVVRECYAPNVPEQIAQSYELCLQILAAEGSSWDKSSDQLRQSCFPPEHRAIAHAANVTGQIPAVGMLHDLVLDQVTRTPLRLAVIAPDRTLNYRELMHEALRVSGWLRDRGASHGDLVAVVLAKGWEQAVATLGVLAAGVAYLPLNPDLPQSRLRQLLELGDVKHVITHTGTVEKLRCQDGTEFLELSEHTLASLPDAVADTPQDTSSLAYVIFTSGTTGEPKGVMIEHGAVCNTIVALTRRFNLGEEDRVLALSAFGFDLSVFDLFGPLSTGGAVVMPPSSTTPNPNQWFDLLQRDQVSIWNTTPGMMEILVDHLSQRGWQLPATLRNIMLSGDRITPDLPGRIHALHPTVEINSLGGATEASIWSILHSVQQSDPAWSNIPYGHALPGQEIHILGSDLNPCPLWAVGEIAIGGKGLARGYWKDPVSTARSFVTVLDGRRLYLTGDLGRLRPSGMVEILGRKDRQAKIRGFRVEPAEVEATIHRHPQVCSAYVFTFNDKRGGQRLAAAIISAIPDSLTTDAIRSYLTRNLPAYMVPSVFMLLDELPLTSNGKVDHCALLARLPSATTPPAHAGQAKTDLEQQLRHIVETLLGNADFDNDDNLLNCGLDSIDMTRLLIKLEEELGIHLNMDSLYDEPTVRALVIKCQATDPHLEQPTQMNARRLLDVTLKDAFRREQHGIRSDLEADMAFPGRPEHQEPDLKRLASTRRSTRHFSPEPMLLKDVLHLLVHLRQMEQGGQVKYLYGSSGGLYPLQVYLYVKPDRVTGLLGGGYYYHPVRHELIQLVRSDDIAAVRKAYGPPHNRAIFEGSAFAVFLVAQLEAIEPVYGQQSWHYVMLEAGLISQLLESAAAHTQLGLCQVGELGFERIRHLFRLSESHRYVHSLLGGLEMAKDAPLEGAVLADVELLTLALPSGKGSPVFCLPGAGGFPISLHKLVEQFSDAQAVYAVRYPGSIPGEEPIADVIEVASQIRHQAAPLTKKQRWRLMGFSYGGVVAFEMARQALAQGERVDLLALIDAAVPDYMRAHPEKVDAIIKNARTSYEHAKATGDNEVISLRRAIWRTTEASVEALSRYRPTPLGADIVIVRAAENRTEVEQGFDHWEPFTQGDAKIVWVPGTKESKFHGHLFTELARGLRKILEPPKTEKQPWWKF